MNEAITELIGHAFGQRGYAALLRDVGAENVPLASDDLTPSQAKVIDVCVNDEIMQDNIAAVFARYEELKIEHDLDASPWYDDV